MRTLFEDLKQWSERGKEPKAKMMMEFVHFLMSNKDKISSDKLQKVQQAISGANSRLIFEYETKLSEMT